MKHKIIASMMALSSLMLSIHVQAHEADAHKDNVQAPDCSSMKGMDHAKMDMNDPVMKAMMEKCMAGMDHNNTSSDKSDNVNNGHNMQDMDNKTDRHQH